MESIASPSVTLPSHTTRPNHQLSGHVFGHAGKQFGILKDNRTLRLLKPIIDIRGKRECEFYQKIWSSEDEALKSFLPRFYGLVTIDSIQFIQIEDATEGLTNYSNMDVKIGILTYGPEADSKKIKDEMSKNPWQELNGFRISGARIYDPTQVESYVVLDKQATRKIEPGEIPNVLDHFLGSQFNSTNARVNLCENYLSKLRSILEWFDKVNINNLKFLSSSLLFVHSADNRTVTLKMIDFAHTYTFSPSNSNETEGKDDNYIFGLVKLIDYFKYLLSRLKGCSEKTTTNNNN